MCMPGKWCLEKFEMCFTFLIMKPSPCALIYDLRQCILPIQLPQPNVSPFHTFRHHPTQVYLLQTCEDSETLRSQGHVFSVITHHKPQIGISSRELLLMEAILHQLMLKYVVYPIIYRVLHIPGGAGVLPSTVCPWISETYIFVYWGDHPFGPNKIIQIAMLGTVDGRLRVSFVFQMFTFPPSYLNFLGNCEFPRNQDANQIKMILRHFLGKPHVFFKLKTLHLPFCSEWCFCSASHLPITIGPSPSTHHLQGTAPMYQHQHHLRRSCIWPCLHLR